MSALQLELASVRGLCPEGVEPAEFLRHLMRENRDLREERSRYVYDRPYQEA